MAWTAEPVALRWVIAQTICHIHICVLSRRAYIVRVKRKGTYARINNKFYALLFIKYCILSFQFLSDRDGVDLLIVPELLVVAVL